jgi:hypothetical protein
MTTGGRSGAGNIHRVSKALRTTAIQTEGALATADSPLAVVLSLFAIRHSVAGRVRRAAGRCGAQRASVAAYGQAWTRGEKDVLW